MLRIVYLYYFFSFPDKSMLSQFCVDVTARANEGHIDPVIGRDIEIQRIVQILCRRTKNNPILLGDPGVGKTAIAEGLAVRISCGGIPFFLSVSFRCWIFWICFIHHKIYYFFLFAAIHFFIYVTFN